MSNQLYIGPPRTSKSDVYSGVLASIFAQQDAKRQQQQAQQDAYLKNIADSLVAVAGDPQEFERRKKSVDPKVIQAVIAKYPQLGFGSYQSPDQQVSAARAKAELGDITGASTPPPMAQNLNDAFVGTGAGIAPGQPSAIDTALARNNRNQGVYKKDLPSELQKASITDATLGDQGLRGAEAIATKQALDAKEQATIPSENALRGAQTQVQLSEVPLNAAKTKDTLADVPLKGAEAGRANADAKKLGAETAGINQTNQLLGGATGTPFTGDLAKAPAIVQMLVNRQYDPTMMRRWKPEMQETILSAARQFDPSLNMQDYPNQYALKKDFTSGKAAANIRSINTAVAHLDNLKRAADGLDNRDLQLWNTVANFGLSQSGDPRVTRFKAAANAVESEMATVFKGTGATDQEIKAWRESLNASQSPEQLHGAINEMIHLMGGRLSSLSSQYQSGTGKPKDFRILNDRSRKILSGLGVNVDEMEGGGTSGGGGKTVTRGELRQLGRTEQEAIANGYTVTN